MIREVLKKLMARQDLTQEEVYQLFVAIDRDELTDAQIAGFQTAMQMKGATITEITAMARAMKDLCVKIAPDISGEMLDTCGTGSGLNTFNISTASAILAAAAGIPVAKHGSKSITGLSGSADVLEALGVYIMQSPRGVEKLIENVGIGFLYAPLFHPLMERIFPVERDLGIRTLFYTMIGPLINPIATRHVMGVNQQDMLDIVVRVADALGYTKAIFVHGEDGSDEISMMGKTYIRELYHGQICAHEFLPEEVGIRRCSLSDIETGTPEANAVMIKDVFSGKDKGPRRQAVVLNSAAVLLAADKADNLKEGIGLANEIISSGAAQNKLNQFIEASHEFKKLK